MPASARGAAVLLGTLLCSALAWPGPVVTDDRGVAVKLPAPAQRVVSLAPFITELVYAVGAGERLVAVSEHSDYPAAARKLPRVGNAFSVSLERLVALRPDLVISWQSGIDPRVVARLESMDIPVFVLEPRRIGDVAVALRRLGELLGTAPRADARARDFNRAIDALRQRYADRPELRVFYQISRQPLMTLNGQHMVSAVLALCGARNVFDDLVPIAPTVNPEQVLTRDPEAILISVAGGRSPDSMAFWGRYASIAAVRHGNVYTVNANVLNRQTPRLVDGARRVCQLLEQARANLRPE